MEAPEVRLLAKLKGRHEKVEKRRVSHKVVPAGRRPNKKAEREMVGGTEAIRD